MFSRHRVYTREAVHRSRDGNFAGFAKARSWGRSSRTHRKGRAFSPIDRSSRRWQLHREIGSHVGNGVGKLLSGMSAGLLTNRRKETTWEENIREESIGRRKEYWPRYEIAGFFYRAFTKSKISDGFCPSTISRRFFSGKERTIWLCRLWFFWPEIN